MAKQRFKVHPAADVFPMMDAETFEGLKADIAANGQNESIVFWCEQLVDGRNRLKACDELGIEPETCELAEDADPFAYVISVNLHRRHLEVGQRAMIAARMAKLKKGDNQHKKGDGSIDPSISNAAALLNVSAPSVKRAKHVLENGSKELVAALEQKQVTLNQAEQLCKSEPDKAEQTAVVKQGKKAVAEKIKEAKAKKPPSKAKAKPVAEPEVTSDPKGPALEPTDKAFVAAFGKVQDRLNSLWHVVNQLKPHEAIILKDWLLTRGAAS